MDHEIRVVIALVLLPNVGLVAVTGEGDAIAHPIPETDILRIDDRGHSAHIIHQVQAREGAFLGVPEIRLTAQQHVSVPRIGGRDPDRVAGTLIDMRPQPIRRTEIDRLVRYRF